MLMQFLTLTCPGNVEVRLNGTGLVFFDQPQAHLGKLNAVLALQWLQSRGSRYLRMSRYFSHLSSCSYMSFSIASIALFIHVSLRRSFFSFFSFFFICHTYVLSVDGNAYVYTRVDLGNTITIQVNAIQYINGNAVAILPNVYW